jgi:hypothetical protein
MNVWFYAKDGQRNGPVSLDEMIRLRGTGSVGPRDLVWCEGMSEWRAAEEVPGLVPPAPSPVPAAPPPVPPQPLNPYQAPAHAWVEPVRIDGEIAPGSDPLQPGECIRRAFELTKRHFWFLFLCGLLYLVLGGSSEALTTALGRPFGTDAIDSGEGEITPVAGVVWFALALVQFAVDVFLHLGLTRIGLNIVSGKPASYGMLFGGASKLPAALVANLLYILMVVGGLILLIVPGIYLALRFGQFTNAIVDKDLGAIEALKYSSRITQGQKGNLLLLGLLCVLITIGGVIAFVVGLGFALPLVYLSFYLSYRWMQYGREAVRDR